MKRILYALLCVGMWMSMPILSRAQLNAHFTANNVSGCSPIVVQFTDQSTGNPTSWLWTLGNGTTSTLQNPSTTYITPGSYTVTLTVFNGATNSTTTQTNYITVLPPPFVNFIASDSTTACAPETVQFTNLSLPGSVGTTNYLWDFGDGNTSTATNPSHTYQNPGNYNVTLVVVNSVGCVKSLVKTQYIRTVLRPTASFTATNNNVCTAPATVTFNNTSTSAVSYIWNFGDGGASTATNPIHTYTVSGSYTVTLIAENSAGCTDTMVQTSLVNFGNPHASFTPTTTTACTGNGVSFTNTSTPGPGNSTWSFGDGTTSTAVSPTHVYTTAGVYTVKLVINYNSCSDSTTGTVTINTGPVVAFAANNTYNCTSPFTVLFNNTTTGAISYLWEFGDGGTSGATSPSYTYNATGSFTVILIATSSNGCKDTLTKPNYIVIAPPTATITVNPSQGCAPLTVTYTTTVNSQTAPTSNLIIFGDGTPNSTVANGTHTYTNPGTYIIKYIYTLPGGCIDTAQATVIAGTPPVAGFTANPSPVCPGSPVTFTNTSTGATSYSWTFGDGGSSTAINPVYTYQNSGTYTVTLYATNNGCTTIHTQQIIVSPPQSFFQFSFFCSNRLQVQPLDNSIGATSWLWNFGDGTTSTQENPIHVYSAYGTYVITLTVTNAATGCTNTNSASVTLYADPLTQLTADNTTVCKHTTVNFTAVTSYPSSNYTWNFGDGTITNTTTPTTTHVYSNSGTYTVKVSQVDGYGCTDSIVNTSYIHVGGAVPNFTGTPLSGCAPLVVNFQDLSTDGTGISIVSRIWRFGDGAVNTGNNTNVSHTYTSGGIYSVTLVTTDSYGCTDSVVKPNYITASQPIAQFYSPDTIVCAGVPVSFINQSSGQGLLASFWIFGDGTTTGSSANPFHTYNASGNYTVSLVITATNGCADTVTHTAYIHVSPLSLGFTVSDSFATCPPMNVSMTNTSIGNNTYTWIFGNGGTSTLTNPTTVYTYPGTYTIKLIGHNSEGCIDSVTKNVIVLGPTGTLSYTAANGCLPLTVQLSSVSQNASSYTWDMNNGFTQTTTSPSFTYTYTQAGEYIPVLVLSNGTCQVSVVGSDTIKVDHVVAGFSYFPTTICQGGTVTFTDTTYNSIAPVNSRHWTFGDGGTSAAHNPTHVYPAAGTYQVTLIIGNATGCLDTITESVTVSSPPIVSAGGPQTICQGQATPVQLQATGAVSYTWSPATGLSCTACANPTALPAATTIYTVTGTNAAGCTNTATVTVTIAPLPAVSAGSTQTICNGSTAQLQATGAVSYVWSPGATLSCTACANPIATPPATTTYTVTGTNANGCSNTSQVTVTVTPALTVSAGANQAICTGSSAQLQATGASTYTWSPATGLSCTACANPVATPTVPTTYTVIGSGGAGCTGTAQVTITINPLPVVSAGAPQSICQGQTTPVQLQATGASTYTWSPATGLSCTACANPTALPAATTTYTVTGTNANGCVNTSTVTVTVNPLPTVSAGGPQTICNGSTAQLQATGAVSYTWSPATGLSCTACANPLANPLTTTTYTVTGANAAGCTSTSQVTVTVSPALNVSAGANQTICTGSLPAQLQATGASTYTWSPAAGLTCTACANPIANPATTTTYTVTGFVGGCSSTAQVTVTVIPAPVINASGGQVICQGQTDSAQLEASGASTYIWSPATGLSCTACLDPTALPATTTTYTVTGTLANGCFDTASVTVTVNPPPTISAGNNQTICSGATASLTATGGATYSWSPTTGLSCPTCATTNASPATTTTYTVIGTTINGCIDSSQVTVTVSATLNVSAGADQTICSGTVAQLQATGASTYSWSPATGLSCTTCANTNASPAATTTYTVIGSGGNGCNATAQVTVTVNPVPTITAANQSACSGVTVQLQATGAVTYSWLPATGLSCTACPNPSANPATTTIYTVIGTAANGCIDSTHVTVTVDTLPVVHASSNQSICAGTSAQLNATGGNTYSWSPATGLSCTTCANPLANPSTTITYTVTGTNTGGCSDTSQVTVTIVPLPVVSVGANQSICAGASAQLQATGGNTYSWSPATGLSCNTCSNPIASPVATTTYTVTGTGNNGCTATAQITVTVNQLPVITAANQIVCSGASVQLNATGAVTYSWSPATGLSCTACANPLANPSITTLYTITGVNANGCIDSSHVTVTVDTLPVVSAGNDQSSCSGTPVQLHATGATTYIWSPATGLSCTACANPAANPSNTTTYIVTGATAGGCTDSSHVTVTIMPLPVVSASQPQSICEGASAQLNATGAISYNWSPATGLSCTACANPVASPTTPITYTVTGTDNNGCTNTSSTTISIYPQPLISGGPAQIECNGTPVQLHASGGLTYTWSPATGLSCTNCSDPFTGTPDNITYTVTGTDADGCTDSATVNVTVIDTTITTISSNDTICAGQTVQLSATGGASYQWTPAAGLNSSNIANPTATPSATTTYMALITENQCFTDTSFVTVVVNQLPTVNMGGGEGVIAGEGIKLNPQVTGDIAAYEWTPATGLSCDTCIDPTATPSATTTYTLNVTTVAGCKASGEITITVGCDKNQIFIPNTFTPNGDGVNDRFYISGKGITTIKRFSVYDRWGELIFEVHDAPVNDPLHGWDGTFKGRQLPPDVYVYMVNAICETGQPLEFKGDISLVR